MVATVRRAWRRAKGLSADGLVWARNTAVKIVLLSLLITFQLWLAFFMYGTFYYASMPTQLHTKPVYLDFSVCDRFDGSNSCPFPSSNVSLVQDPSEKLFMPGQRYTIRMEIELPQSPVNENLGNFMVNLQLYSKADEVNAQSSRPAMLRYRSPFLKIVDVVFLAPFLVGGYTEEKQNLNVELMHDFMDNAYKPSVKLSIQLRARHIEIYSSVVKIHAQFTGLRYLMFYWPLTTAGVSVFVNFCFLSILSMLLWRQCVTAFLGEGILDDLDGGSSPPPTLTYEDRRRMARQSMEAERSNLFGSRPPHVTIVDPLDYSPPRAQIQSSESSQRVVRRRRSKEDGASSSSSRDALGEREGQSDNSDSTAPAAAKGGDAVVETLQGESGMAESSGGSTSTTSDDTPPGFEKVEKEDVVEGEDNVDVDDGVGEELEEAKGKESLHVAFAGHSESEQSPIKPPGILRHRTSHH